MKTRPLALIIGTVLASQHAAAIDTPPGWERKSMPSGAIYSPKNEEGREIGVEISDLIAGQGSPAQALNLFADAINSSGMTIVQRGEVEESGNIATLSLEVEYQGKSILANLTVYPVGNDKMRIIDFQTEKDAELLQRHQKTITALIAAQYLEDQGGAASAPASSTASSSSASTASSSTSTASSTGSSGNVKGGVRHGEAFMRQFKMDGLTPGGDLVFGDYQCKVQIDGGAQFTLSLYENGEYRISGFKDQTGEFRYENDGRINISSKHFLYNYENSDGETKEIAFFFRHKDGELGIYGQNIGDNFINVCQYQGAAKNASPTQQAADDAEARRFKWVTAPGKGVALGDIEALYNHVYNDYSGIGVTLEHDIWLLLKDGQAYKDLPVSPADFDVAASRQHEPDKWYAWRRKGDGYEIQKDGEWQELEGVARAPAKTGETIEGSYTHYSSGGTYYSSFASFDTINFKRDGTFSDSSRSTIHSNTAGLGDDGVIAHSGNFSTGAGGRYHIDGYTIELTYPNGKTERELFFFWNNERNSLNIGETTYSTD